MVLSVVAIVIAMVMAFVLPGPQGATGAQGDAGPAGAAGTNGLDGTDGATGAQGPPGNGTIMAYSSSILVNNLQTTCTHHTNGNVTITVPGPGTIVVTSTVKISLDHTAGTDDVPRVFIGTNATDCTIDAWRAFLTISETQATDTYWVNIFVQKPFTIPAAGTYTYYVNGNMWSGQSGGDIYLASGTIAVFYPA
jgi:hypothetical protein